MSLPQRGRGRVPAPPTHVNYAKLVRTGTASRAELGCFDNKKFGTVTLGRTDRRAPGRVPSPLAAAEPRREEPLARRAATHRPRRVPIANRRPCCGSKCQVAPTRWLLTAQWTRAHWFRRAPQGECGKPGGRRGYTLARSALTIHGPAQRMRRKAGRLRPRAGWRDAPAAGKLVIAKCRGCRRALRDSLQWDPSGSGGKRRPQKEGRWLRPGALGVAARIALWSKKPTAARVEHASTWHPQEARNLAATSEPRLEKAEGPERMSSGRGRPATSGNLGSLEKSLVYSSQHTWGVHLCIYPLFTAEATETETGKVVCPRAKPGAGKFERKKNMPR
nr:uncharacterized protein LOC129036240 [Pongo pygmaeus]